MPKLSTIINEITKDHDTQLATLSQFGQDVQNWSNNTNSQQLVNYTESNQPNDETSTSVGYVTLKNFSFNFTANNPICLVSLTLSLKGVGKVGIFINGLLTQEIPFQNAGFANVTYAPHLNLNGSSTKFSVQWKASTGTITKASSQANPGLNQLFITSTNS